VYDLGAWVRHHDKYEAPSPKAMAPEGAVEVIGAAWWLFSAGPSNPWKDLGNGRLSGCRMKQG
jgi:hypothetical protein